METGEWSCCSDYESSEVDMMAEQVPGHPVVVLTVVHLVGLAPVLQVTGVFSRAYSC